MIDRKLQKECRKRAIKRVAENFNTTQKHVREILSRSYNLDNPMLTYKYAVENWTVEFYHQATQKKYLPTSSHL